MRPTKLTMSAFGPYRDKTVLDMNLLGTQGIYLISGETGAGKTTIFDAIVYALYGKTSGDDSTSRDEKMIRCAYADETVPTYVEMEFEIRGERYFIKRNPEYKRPKARGEGYTTESAGVVLCLPNGEYAKGTATSVNEQIVRIIGVDKNQFCKLAMLAQGDFQKFLLDTTKNKTAILRRIFSTGIFDSVQNLLKSEVGEINKKYQALNREVELFLSDAKFADNDTAAFDFENAVCIEEKRDILQTVVENDSLRRKQLEEKAGLLDTEISRAKEAIGAARRKNELTAQLKQLTVQLEQKTAACKALKKQCEDAEKLSDRLEEIIAERESCKEALRQLELLEKARAELLTAGKEIQQTRSERDKLGRELEDIKTRIAAMQDMDRLISDAEKRMAQLENTGRELKRYLEAQGERNALRERLAPLQLACEAGSGNYENAYRLYISEQAGILAQELREGEPCAVCGSLIHPSPAPLHENAPDKNELERLKKIRDDAERKRSDLLLKLELVSQTVSNSADALRLLTDSESYDEALREQIRSEYLAQRTVIKAQEERKREKASLEQALPEIEKRIAALDEKLTSLAGKSAAAQERLHSTKPDFSDRKEIEAKRNTLSEQYDEIKTNTEKARTAYTSCNAECARLSGSADAAAAELEKLKNITADVQQLDDRLLSLNADKNALAQEREALSNRLAINEKILKRLQGHIEKIASAEKELMWKKSLSDTANGTIADGRHKKITLENYVLCEYFKRILGRASVRLMAMSGGRYELILRNDDSNYRSQVGLDAGVIDHYNGGSRSVRSLSGGEKFMASLSLALGLSDEVQSLTGGIQLDTMFVDEGFGSLDSNTLELAMRVLQSLADSNRLVGIISHVDALESRIGRQIAVTKASGMGSKAEIVI